MATWKQALDHARHHRLAWLQLLALVAASGCDPSTPAGLFAPAEITELQKLAHPSGKPPPDSSNKYIGNPDAIALGKRFYFDPDFSGAETGLDMLGRPLSTPGRAAIGERTKVSCNSCHDVSMGGSDHTMDPPGNRVSMGGGAYDVNGEQTINAAYNKIVYWNGRNDSLWSQIVAVEESFVSVAGSRLRVAWRIADAYRADYQKVFADNPLPMELDSVTAQKARLAADGTCLLDSTNQCPATYCHVVTSSDGSMVCLPRYPLDARPGWAPVGYVSPCDWGSRDPLQPFGDAYDCMDLEDQRLMTRVLVNFAKAIAAYEYTLLTPDAPFDKWVDEGPNTSTRLSPSAARGAQLFVGSAACKECHSGPLLTDNLFHDIGVPQIGTYVPLVSDCPQGTLDSKGAPTKYQCDCVSDDKFQPMNCLPDGARDGIRKLEANKFRRDSLWSDDLVCAGHYTDHFATGYATNHPDECDGMVKYYEYDYLTGSLTGQWKTPGLRNVELTGPYFHDGVFSDLHDVVKHYSNGGVATMGTPVGTVDEKIKKLNLTEGQINDVVEFLKTLTEPVDPAITSPPMLPASSNF